MRNECAVPDLGSWALWTSNTKRTPKNYLWWPIMSLCWLPQPMPLRVLVPPMPMPVQVPKPGTGTVLLQTTGGVTPRPLEAGGYLALPMLGQSGSFGMRGEALFDKSPNYEAFLFATNKKE